MKSALLLTTILFFAEAKAQGFPLDEEAKYFEANVVVAEGFSVSFLFENGSNWLKAPGNITGRVYDLVTDSLNHRLSANFEVGTYSQSGVFRKQTGSITYHFQLEMKDGKYRYAFSDFIFHYYATNRNLKVVDTGKIKPLEEKSAPGWQHLWNQHKNDIHVIVRQQIDKLSKAMVAKPEVTTQQVKPKIDW